MLLERGRVLLEAADKLTTDAEALARGWETHLTLGDRSAGAHRGAVPAGGQTGRESQYPAVDHHRGAGRGVGAS